MSGVRAALMPTDPETLDFVTGLVDEWWQSLTPGQRMTAMLRTTDPVWCDEVCP